MYLPWQNRIENLGNPKENNEFQEFSQGNQDLPSFQYFVFLIWVWDWVAMLCESTVNSGRLLFTDLNFTDTPLQGMLL